MHDFGVKPLSETLFPPPSMKTRVRGWRGPARADPDGHQGPEAGGRPETLRGHGECGWRSQLFFRSKMMKTPDVRSERSEKYSKVYETFERTCVLSKTTYNTLQASRLALLASVPHLLLEVEWTPVEAEANFLADGDRSAVRARKALTVLTQVWRSRYSSFTTLAI